MRNRYPGTCYQCGGVVKAGEGHFQRFRGEWLVHHAGCAIKHRNERIQAREEKQRRKVVNNPEQVKWV